MRQLPVAVLICGGAVVVLAAEGLGDMWLMGVGFLVTLAGLALGILLRRDRFPEKLTGFADELDRTLPSGGTGRASTPRSAGIGLAYVTVTALCWAAVFMLGGEVGGSTAETVLAAAGSLLILGGWLERLSRIWGWRWTAAWAVALPLSLLVYAPLGEWGAGAAFFAVLMYGAWTWPGIHGWERQPRRRRPRKSRPGRRARRRARERQRAR